MKTETAMGNDETGDSSGGGIANKILLGKIDKLRELNVGSVVPLPQLVVVGDQSSGKSSVLESLTGFSFPRAAGLCTRYATQITCRREARKSIYISIIPRPDSDSVRKERLKGFYRQVIHIDGSQLEEIFKEANEAMGIRLDTTYDNTQDTLNTFSEDILKIEINGPDQDHLTVIDVPGIFRAETPGLTSKDDIELVKGMVQRYMKDRRTIILAVIPCNVDIATQEILKLAKDADPEGVRTMGVLTKPDLVIEQATQQVIVDLVMGKRNDLHLGYCLVKNRGADDKHSSLKHRHLQEKAFFDREPWSSIPEKGRVGVDALKLRLGELLMDISRREFPHVKAEIMKKLSECRETLEKMGPSRGESDAQRVYLTKLSTEFQRIASYAINAHYTEHPMFTEAPGMRLITRVLLLNDAFSHVFATKAHMRHFEKAHGTDDDAQESKFDGPTDFEVPLDRYSDLHDIINTEQFDCPEPTDESIMEHIERVFNSSRGPELGTFGGSLLGTTFREQSKKWEELVLSHVSNAIVIVHHFIVNLTAICFPEKAVRDELWDNILVDELRDAYRKAMKKARFLLEIEREGQPITLNHYFNSNLQHSRLDRIRHALGDLTMEASKQTNEASTSFMVETAKLQNFSQHKGNPQQVREDIHDILKSYYKVSRKRFVDVICQQVINYYLLNGKKSPLKILCPNRIAEMNEDQLEMIAGEDAGTKRQRQLMTDEIQRLEAAMKVLRG